MIKLSLSLIVAMDRNRLIGANGRLPWRLPDDMAWFKQQTMGKPVIMGRKTYESIPPRFRPLPGRKNIVLTRNPSFDLGDSTGKTVVCHTPKQALAEADGHPESVIIGGEAIYATFLPQVSTLYLTQIDATFEGDAYFPAWDSRQFRLTLEQHHPTDKRHAQPFSFQIWQRISSS